LYKARAFPKSGSKIQLSLAEAAELAERKAVAGIRFALCVPCEIERRGREKMFFIVLEIFND
jgi:hypothetical protein